MIRKKDFGLQTKEEMAVIGSEQLNDISQMKGIGKKTTEKIKSVFGKTSIFYLQMQDKDKLKKAGLTDYQISALFNLKPISQEKKFAEPVYQKIPFHICAVGIGCDQSGPCNANGLVHLAGLLVF